MRYCRLFVVMCVGLVAVGADAGLVGSTINISAYYPNQSTVFSNPGNVIVTTPGIEYAQGSFASYSTSWEINITDTQVIIRDAGGNGFPFGGNVSFNGFILTMINGPGLISASVDPLSGFSPVSVSVAGNQVLMNFVGVNGTSMSSSIINITTVPGPGAAAAFLLLGVTIPGRRRSMQK